MKRSRGHSHKGPRIEGWWGRRLVPFKISSKNRHEGAFAPSSLRARARAPDIAEGARLSLSLFLAFFVFYLYLVLFFFRRRPINSDITRGHVNASCDFRSLRRHIGSVSADAVGRGARLANVKLDSCSILPETFIRGRSLTLYRRTPDIFIYLVNVRAFRRIGA